MPTRGRVVVLSAVLAFAGAACGSAQQSPSPSAAASASPLAPGPSPSLPPSVAATSPSPSPTAAPASQEPARSFAKVVADSPLVVRTRPGTDQYSAIIDWRVQPGQKVEVEGGPVDASGYPWYWIRVGARDGWVAGQSRNGQKWLDVSSVTFRPATGWTGPRGVGHDECTITTSAIVVDGALHLAAYCEGSVGYLTNASGKWTATTFPSSGNQSHEGAKLATDGSRLYMAFTRSQPLACGIDYLGVYYRSRALPNGSWSLASRIGPAGDVLQSFQVRGGKLHLTVVGGFYETNAGGSLKRYPLPGATSGASMQVGSDGRARIAYETSGALRYAVFNGSGFDWSAIPGTMKLDTAPGLVLDAQDNAYLTYLHNDLPHGCGERDATPEDGTYYATNATGGWTPLTSRRITVDLGAASLAVGPSGDVHALVSGEYGIRQYVKGAGWWDGQLLASSSSEGTALLIDPSSGRSFVVFTDRTGAIRYLTKP